MCGMTNISKEFPLYDENNDHYWNTCYMVN